LPGGAMKITNDSITLVLAIWGAVVSTVAVLWNIIRDSQNRTKVRVHAMIAVSAGRVRSPGPKVLAVEITNVGRHAVVIKGIASDSGKKSGHANVAVTTHIPRRLEAKDSVVEPLIDFGFIGPTITRLYAWDSTGKYWYLPKKQLAELVRKAKEQGLT
jgi:hypothetical protein